MAYMKSGLPFLYDDTTGDIVGIKDADGSERMFLFGKAPAEYGVTLPRGVTGLSSQLATAIDYLKRSRSDRLCVLAVDSDSTASGHASIAATHYTAGNLLGAAHVMGRSLAEAGLKVNNTTWFGFASLQSLATIGGNGLADTRVTVGAGWTETIDNTIAGSGYWANSTTANPLSFYCDEQVDTCKLVYITNNGSTGGTITLDIGGAALYSAACNASPNIVMTSAIALGKPDNYTININKALAASNIFVLGVIAWNSRNPGVTILSNSGPGKTIAQAVMTTAGYMSGAFYAAVQPDLVFASHILNNLGAVGYQASLATLLGLAQRSGAADVVVYDGPQAGASAANYTNQATRLAEAKAAAAAANCAHLSCADYLGPNPSTGNVNYLAENVGHLTPLGNTRLYTALAQSLTAALRAA